MEKCIRCKTNIIYVKKRKLCRQCYGHERYCGRKGTSYIYHCSEVEFIKNFFSHKNWLYHPVIFRLDGFNYEPDFYDGERNIFIEVVGTKQAFSANFEKYKLFVKTFPHIKYEIRNTLGEIKPLSKRAYNKKTG